MMEFGIRGIYQENSDSKREQTCTVRIGSGVLLRHIKSKCRAKQDYTKTKKDGATVWLLTIFEDVMVRFEEAT